VWNTQTRAAIHVSVAYIRSAKNTALHDDGRIFNIAFFGKLRSSLILVAFRFGLGKKFPYHCNSRRSDDRKRQITNSRSEHLEHKSGRRRADRCSNSTQRCDRSDGQVKTTGAHCQIRNDEYGELLETIPMIGPILAAIFALRSSTSFMMVLGFALYAIALRFSIDQLFGPLILGKASRLHPAIVIFSTLAGAILYGIVGIILAVPVSLLMKVTWRRSTVSTNYLLADVVGDSRDISPKRRVKS
jgi:hypothetical protein